MSTTPDTGRAVGPRLVEIATAQAAYDTLANDLTWSPSKVQAELTAASDLARLYDALSIELTGPLGAAVRHARQYLDHQVTELDARLSEDITDQDIEDEEGKAAGARRLTANAPTCPGCTRGEEVPGHNGAVVTVHDVACSALPPPGVGDRL
jgi:hypothetical protein